MLREMRISGNVGAAYVGDPANIAAASTTRTGHVTSQRNTPAVMLRKAAKVEKGSGVPNKDKVGKVTRTQIKEIAEAKMKDLNAIDLEGAMKQIEGTARSMGITVTD